MPHDNAVNPDVKSEIVAAPPADNTASTATTPETETQTASTSSLMERLGVPAEAQQELQELNKQSEPEQSETPPEAETPEVEAEPVESPETPPEENPTEEQPEAHGDWPESAKKRVAKLAEQKRKAKEKAEELEEQLERVQAQLEATQPVTVAPNESDLLADVTSEQQLEERVKIAKVARDWCRSHPTGFTENEGTENERFIPPEEIAQALGRAEDVIQEHAPRKRAELQQRHQYDAMAKKEYPTVFDRTTEDYLVGNAILRQVPGLINHPAKNLILGDYIAGVKLRLNKAKPNGAAPHKDVPEELLRKQPPIAPHVPTASRSNGSQVPSRKKVDQAKDHVAREGGDRDALKAAIRAIREANEQNSDPRSLVAV